MLTPCVLAAAAERDGAKQAIDRRYVQDARPLLPCGVPDPGLRHDAGGDRIRTEAVPVRLLLRLQTGPPGQVVWVCLPVLTHLPCPDDAQDTRAAGPGEDQLQEGHTGKLAP